MKRSSKASMPGIILLISITFTCLAQTQGKEATSAEERARRMTEWMKMNLQLTADQDKHVHEVNLTYADKTEELLHSNKPMAKKVKKLRAYNEDRDNGLIMLLTSDQFKTYQTKKAEARERLKAKAREKENMNSEGPKKKLKFQYKRFVPS